MQIKCLPRNVYRFYAWARSQECLDEHRRTLEASVRHWESLRAEGVSEAKCAEFVGISRATYYRRRARHKALARGVLPPSKAPKRRNKTPLGGARKAACSGRPTRPSNMGQSQNSGGDTARAWP